MTPQEIDRIECAIRHIQTAVDVDPWAVEIAVKAMEKQIPKKPIRNAGLINPTWVEEAYLCPICFGWAGSIGFCSRCGQAIGWTESE
jgi:hypothetical protein